MKYVVTNTFIDKTTKKRYRTGETFECDKKRFEEISKAGDFLAPMKEKSEDTAPNRFEAMSVVELRQYADATYKLTFAENVGKEEMIAVLTERESKKG